jgi:hypothetical protein
MILNLSYAIDKETESELCEPSSFGCFQAKHLALHLFSELLPEYSLELLDVIVAGVNVLTLRWVLIFLNQRLLPFWEVSVHLVHLLLGDGFPISEASFNHHNCCWADTI